MHILLIILLTLVAIPVLVLLAQTILALGRHKPTWIGNMRRPRIGIIVPAHNEAAIIERTLASLRAQLMEGDRLLVVADNCTDDTARVARDTGCEVIERLDARRRGKGYALDFGVRHLAGNPPDAVLVVDADCIVEDGAVDRLARAAVMNARPVQARYVMRAPSGAGLMGKIAEFAWLVRNMVRPLGFRRLGLPCQLMGTGMAFPWALLSNASLASGHIVEDLKLGIDLAMKGAPPLFYPDAVVASTFPSNAEGMKSQRTRWEHGHIGVILHDAPGLLLAGLRHGNPHLVALALDLCVPPVALLCLIACAAFLVAVFYYAATAISSPLMFAGGILLALVCAVALSWWRFGRPVLSFGNLLLAAWYALRKVPLYLRFLVHRQMEWVRSKRDAE